MRLKNLKHTFIHISNENYRRIFTNKASDELKRRCKQRCADTKQSFFGTIDKFYISQIIIPFSSHVTGNITEYEIVDNIDESSKYAPLLEESFSSKKESILVEGLQEGKIFLKYMDMYKWIIPNEYGDESSVQQDLNLHYAATLHRGSSAQVFHWFYPCRCRQRWQRG